MPKIDYRHVSAIHQVEGSTPIVEYRGRLCDHGGNPLPLDVDECKRMGIKLTPNVEQQIETRKRMQETAASRFMTVDAPIVQVDKSLSEVTKELEKKRVISHKGIKEVVSRK